MSTINSAYGFPIKATISECVIWSLGIEPTSTEGPDAGTQGEFARRQRFAINWLGDELLCEKGDARDENTRVRLADFARVAIDFGWDLPYNMRLLAACAATNEPIAPPKAELTGLTERPKTTYLNTIGALLRLLTEGENGSRALFPNSERVKDSIESKFPNVRGLSRRNLDKTFAEAGKSLSDSSPETLPQRQKLR